MAVVIKHRRSRTDLGSADDGLGIGSELVVEAPVADGLPDSMNLGHSHRIADFVEDAFVGVEVGVVDFPFTTVAHFHRRPDPVNQATAGTADVSRPNALALDFRVKLKHGRVLVARKSLRGGHAQ